MDRIFYFVGLVAAVVMPLWNIPLVVRIIRRRTSMDISLAWVIGVWACIILMFPSTLQSKDLVFKAYGIMNTALFTVVLVVVLAHRNGSKER